MRTQSDVYLPSRSAMVLLSVALVFGGLARAQDAPAPTPSPTPPSAPAPQSVPEQSPARLRVAPAMAEARVLYRPAPDYPTGAGKTKSSVELAIVVGRDGRVTEAHAVGGDPGLRARAAATVQEWRYEPYLVDGAAIEFESSAEVPFDPAISTPHALATSAYQAGYQAFLNGDYEDALKAFRHVLQYEPKFPGAWNEVGRIHLVREEYDQALEAFQKELEVNAADLHARNNLGLAHWLQKKYPEALSDFREQLRKHPGDESALTGIGLILEEQKDYAAALPALQKALPAAPGNMSVRIALANCFCRLQRERECTDAIEAAAGREATAENWQSVASAMVSRQLRLDDAQKYALRAVRSFDIQVADIDLEKVSSKNLQDMVALAGSWQTLGRIYMEREEPQGAEPYLKTAWMLRPDSDLLAQFLQKQGNKEAAEHYPRLSANGWDRKAGDEPMQADSAGPSFAKLNTQAVGIAPAGFIQGEFYFFTREGKEKPEVKWIGGDEGLRPFAEALLTVRDPAREKDSPAKNLLRRIEVTCVQAGAPCSVRFLTAAEALQRARQAHP